MTRRFVILQHDHPFLHWDLLLEDDTSARCWRLLREPCAGEPIAAEALPPHRLLYLDYEGPVAEDRGTVRRVLCGSYTDLESVTDGIHVHFTHSAVLASGRLLILSDGRQFWTFDAA